MSSNDNSQQVFFPQTLDTPDKQKGTTAPPSNVKSQPVQGSSPTSAQVFFPQTSSVPQRSGETEQPSTLEKADKAITSTLETNPENLKSLARTNLIEAPKTLGREIYSGVKTIAGMPSAIYHAAADEATPEERGEYAQFEKEHGEAPGAETSGMKRIGLGIQRLSGIPAAVDAAKTYADPKTRPGYQQILENAPEALGQGAGTVVGGELLGKGTKAAIENAPAAASTTVDIARTGVEKAKPHITPKNIGRVGGGVVGGKVGTMALPGYGTIGGAAEGADLGGRLTERLLGKERANTPIFKTSESAAQPSAEPSPIPSRTAKPAPEEPNPLTRNMTPIGQTVRPAGLPRIGEVTPESPLAQTLEQTEAAVKPAVEAAKSESGLKPLGAKPEEPAMKPLGSTTKPAVEEAAEVRQARHVLGNVAVDKLKDVENGPEALRRLTKGTYQNYADLANALEVEKPAYLKARNGETWNPEEFKRTTKEHGKELSGPKETVVRELLSKPPAEILQHTQPFVDPTAKYAAKMNSLTERTMKALNLSEEAKNNMRASGVGDAQAQSLLAKLTKRQLENLSQTMEKGEHLPTVSGGSQGADLSPNASGESAASQEAINRTASEKAKGTKYYRLARIIREFGDKRSLPCYKQGD